MDEETSIAKGSPDEINGVIANNQELTIEDDEVDELEECGSEGYCEEDQAIAFALTGSNPRLIPQCVEEDEVLNNEEDESDDDGEALGISLEYEYEPGISLANTTYGQAAGLVVQQTPQMMSSSEGGRLFGIQCDNSGGGDSSVEGDSGGSNRSRRSGAAIKSVTGASPNRRWSIAHNMTGSYTAGMTYSGAATPKSPRAGASTCFCSGGLDYETVVAYRYYW